MSPFATGTELTGVCMFALVENCAVPICGAGLKVQVWEVEAESGSLALYPG